MLPWPWRRRRRRNPGTPVREHVNREFLPGTLPGDGAVAPQPRRAWSRRQPHSYLPTSGGFGMVSIEREVVKVPAMQSALQLDGIDHVELYVGNAYQAAHFYRSMFGFRPVARAGLETGVRDRLSIVMEQGDIRLVLTSGLDPDSPIARHAALHGDGVKDVAFRVDDVAGAFE